jgi:hypothetical protein
MEAKFTPGPWTVEDGGIVGFGAPVIASKPGVEHIAWITRGLPGDGWPDARLIAAAPDLFEALSYLVAQYSAFGGASGNQADAYYGLVKGKHARWEAARAALSKALGQSTESEGA